MMRPFGAVRNAIILLLVIMLVYYKFGLEDLQEIGES